MQKCILSAKGKLSPFSFQRGICQGCALSGMLYNVSVEPLLALLRTSVFGVSLKKTPKSSFQLMLIFVLPSQIKKMFVRSLVVLPSLSSLLLQGYGTVTEHWICSQGLIGIIVAFLVGLRPPSSSLPVLPGGMQCSCEGFKYFGLFLGIEAYQQKNWENFLEQIKLKLARWKRLHHLLSLKTRVTIINNLVVPYMGCFTVMVISGILYPCMLNS